MAYNPENAVNMIYKFKSAWTDADKKGDNAGKFDAETNARKYYEELKKSGYASLADELSKSNVAEAAKRKKFYAQTGRTATRDYLYSLGKKYDMSSGDVDKLISYNDTTGEISFGGKNMGKPDAEVDGVSYWNDTSKMDNAFKNYIDRSGTVRPVKNAVNQENENLFAKYSKEYDDLKNTNPFTTDEAKSILAKYDLASLTARDNEAASGASSNGGNIDSYAAANALRQQASLVNQGQQAVLASYNSKLEHARNLLSDMGVNIERVFNEDETAKNNDVSRKATVAGVTGYTPSEWSLQTDPVLKQYVDENGKIKKEYLEGNINFQNLINDAKANGDNELARKYAILRGIKILGDFNQYGKYLNEGDIAYLEPQKTEDARQFNEQIAASDRALAAETENNAAERQNKLDQISAAAEAEAAQNANSGNANTAKPTLTAAQAAAAIKNGEKSQAVIDAYNYYYGTDYTVDNPPVVKSSGSSAEDSGNSAEVDYIKKLNETYNNSSKTVKKYIRNVLEPLLQTDVKDTEIAQNLIENSEEYDLEVEDIKAICEALKIDSKWVDDYKNKGLFGWGKGVKENK